MSDSRASFVTAVIAVVAAVVLVDPTMPPSHLGGAGPEAPAALRLQAIVRSQEREFAVIDGQRVVPGDRVGAWRVVEIGPDSVRLRDDARELELRLAPLIRRPVTPPGEQP